MTALKPAAALAALALAAAPAAAQQADAPDAETSRRLEQAERYADCMTRARADPEQALGLARTWRDEDGGAPARHCVAVALMTLGRYEEAGRRLEALAKSMTGAERGLRVDALAQAGQAWILAGKPERAHAAQTAALELAPDDVELLIDRALTLAQAGRFWESIDDLNRASELAPKRADVYVYRASAYRYVDALELAREDADRALELDPDHPEGLLERGIVRRLSGNNEGARRDWLKLIDRHAGTPAAEAAKANLEKMDVEADDGGGGETE